MPATSRASFSCCGVRISIVFAILSTQYACYVVFIDVLACHFRLLWSATGIAVHELSDSSHKLVVVYFITIFQFFPQCVCQFTNSRTFHFDIHLVASASTDGDPSFRQWLCLSINDILFSIVTHKKRFNRLKGFI